MKILNIMLNELEGDYKSDEKFDELLRITEEMVKAENEPRKPDQKQIDLDFDKHFPNFKGDMENKEQK